MDDYNMYVPNVHYELIPIKNLVSNQEYQRVLSSNQVKKVAANFDVYQINPVNFSKSDFRSENPTAMEMTLMPKSRNN